MSSIHSVRTRSWLICALGLFLLSPAIGAAADTIVVKEKQGRKRVERPVSALDREAVNLLKAKIMKVARKTDVGIVLTEGVISGVPQYSSVEIRLPLQFRIVTKALSEADRMNGLEWSGTIYVHSVASRGSKMLYAHQYDPAVTEWGPWADKSLAAESDFDKPTHIFSVNLTKSHGIWPGLQPDSPVAYPVPNYTGIAYFQIIDYRAERAQLDAANAANAARRSQAQGAIPANAPTPAPAAVNPGATNIAQSSATPSADRLLGTWNTTADAGRNEAVIKIKSLSPGTGDVGSVRYTRTDCGFALTLVASNSPRFEFQERLKSPLKVLKCGSGARLIFELTSDTTVRVTAVNPTSGAVLGTVNLVAAASTPEAPDSACPVEAVRAHLTAKSATCELLWRYHVMRQILIPYVARQRAFIDVQSQGLARVQGDTKAIADTAELVLAFGDVIKTVFAVPGPQHVKLLDSVIITDDLVETLYGVPDTNDCGPGLREWFKLGLTAKIMKPAAAEVIPPAGMKAGGCVIALFGERALVLPARNSLVLTQDILQAYYKSGGDYERAAELLGVKATSLLSLVKAKAAAYKFGPMEYNPLTTTLAVTRLIAVIDKVAAECAAGTSCNPP